MTKSSHAFVRFNNLMRAFNKGDPKNLSGKSIHPEAVAILAYVSSQNDHGLSPTITQVVQKLEFGTTPTVQRRVKELHKSGFIEIVGGNDKRHRLLNVTPEGDAYLNECSRLLKAALAECTAPCSC